MDYSEGERLTRCPPYGADTEWTEWTVYTILDKMVDSAPHVTCLLADDATLIDAQLSNAEIWCILAVTNRRIQLPEYLKHRIIPVRTPFFLES
jgi:hypothetical protein